MLHMLSIINKIVEPSHPCDIEVGLHTKDLSVGCPDKSGLPLYLLVFAAFVRSQVIPLGYKML